MLKVKVTLKSGRGVIGDMLIAAYQDLNDFYWVKVGTFKISVDCIEAIEVIGND